MSTYNTPFSEAIVPRPWLRRIAHSIFFPWAQPFVAFLLLVFSIHIGTPSFWGCIWWVSICVLATIEDLSSAQSQIARVFYWITAKLGKQYEPAQFTENQVYSRYPYPLFFRKRHDIRWQVALFILLLSWFFAIYQSRVIEPENLARQAVLSTFLLLFGIIPFSVLIITRMGTSSRLHRYLLWTIVGCIGALVAPFCYIQFTNDWLLIILADIFIFLLYTTIFVTQRLWAGERVRDRVMRMLGEKLLTLHNASKSLKEVPQIIGEKLSHDRVFILQITPDRQYLYVSASYGDLDIASERLIPVDQSITGKAYQKKLPVVWNDVSVCSYYYALDVLDTRAEIAVPIMHNDMVFGVLDVQSKHTGVYGPTDVDSLATIAGMLGAAIAVDEQERFFNKGIELLENVIQTDNYLDSEESVFDLFAIFAHEILRADLVIYFPLSFTGCAIKPPFTSGKFRQPEYLKPPLNDPESDLIKLVQAWYPRYDSKATSSSPTMSLTPHQTKDFVTREGICATCFIPIGTKREKLGGLFLNFRRPEQFSTRFRFTILSLAQSLAKVTAQVRYRHTLVKGFGRPEFRIHNLINRYGLKEGFLAQLAVDWQGCQENCCQTPFHCGLHPYFQQMDYFIEDIYLIQSAMPPDFWQSELEERLLSHASSMPPRLHGRRPDLNLIVEPEIEKESGWLKLSLYRVLSEAINNAIFHGEATQISASVLRRKHYIVVEFSNNGKALPANAEEKQSSNGIFTLLNAFEETLGAQTEISANGNAGTKIDICIPALPPSYQRNHHDFS